MKGIILAGGQGSRLHPVTMEIPKPLITIKKRPLMNYNVKLFVDYGVDDIKVIIRPIDRKDYDRWYAEHSAEFPNARIALVEEPEAMGTLGYIFHNLREWMGEEDIFVVNGDGIIKGLDLSAMLAVHRKSGAPATISVMSVKDPSEYGSVLVSEDKIKGFLEKQENLPEGLVSAGMYLINAGAIAHIEDTVPSEKKMLMFEKDLFPVLAKADKLGAFVSPGKFYDCGTFKRWEEAIREV